MEIFLLMIKMIEIISLDFEIDYSTLEKIVMSQFDFWDSFMEKKSYKYDPKTLIKVFQVLYINNRLGLIAAILRDIKVEDITLYNSFRHVLEKKAK